MVISGSAAATLSAPTRRKARSLGLVRRSRPAVSGDLVGGRHGQRHTGHRVGGTGLGSRGRPDIAAIPARRGPRGGRLAGFALPALQARHSALTASVIVGVLWMLWHLPLLLGGDPAMATYPLVPYTIWIIAESVIYTWLYNNTRGSLLIAVLLHGISNVVGPFSAAPWATTGITVALALLVVLVFGPRHLSRTGLRITLPGTALEAGNRNIRPGT
jgi:hypothetical protein